MIHEGFFRPDNPCALHPIVDSRLNQGGRFMVLADFESYGDAHAGIEEEFKGVGPWTRKSIVNYACIG